MSPDLFDSDRFARTVETILQRLGFDSLNVYVYAMFVEDENTV